MKKRYVLLKYTLHPLIKLYIKKINGKENLPKKGSFVVVSNHNSSPDEVVLLYLFVEHGQRNIGGLTSLRPYKKTFFNNLLIGFVNIFLNFFFKQISIYDGNIIENSVKALKDDTAFLIFPEGKQNYGNKNLLKGKTGAARIALVAKVPVIPIGIQGSEKIIPKNTFLPRFHRMSLNIGKPLTFEKFYGKEGDKETIETITRILMNEIAYLCGKIYPY